MITKDIFDTPEYSFIQENEHLGKHVILLGLSGSYSYGTSNELSDIDIRGITLNRKSDLVGLTNFEQYVDNDTDTCIYGFNKIIKLLVNCNPNTIELLGLNPEHYLFLNDIGKELVDHKKMFLSKYAVQSFGGYASAQLRRLQNALARDSYPQEDKEEHILSTINHAMYEFSQRYEEFDQGKVRLFTDKSNQLDYNSEIFMDISLNHYPLRDYKNMWSEMNSIVKAYEKIGKRNRKKDDNHLNKHAMHLIRLFMMAIDILEKEEINTFRYKEQDMLLSIRKGEFLRSDGTYRDEFYEMLTGYEKRLDYAADNTSLPESPDMIKIEDFVMSVNERVVKDDI